MTWRSSPCSSSRWSSWTPPPPSPRGPWPSAGASSPSWSTASSWARSSIPLYANWVWGGGWLSKLGSNFGLGHGHVDFAGSSVVHLTGGVLALVGAKLLGPRQGKFTKDGTPNAIPGHHLPDGDRGLLHPRLRLVRVQCGLHPGGHRPADRRGRREHHAGRFRRGLFLDDLHLAAVRQAGHQHVRQRPAGRAGGHHRPVRLRHRAGRPF